MARISEQKNVEKGALMILQKKAVWVVGRRWLGSGKGGSLNFLRWLGERGERRKARQDLLVYT